jgi:hypothetical protein
MMLPLAFIIAGLALVAIGVLFVARPELLRQIGYDRERWKEMAWYGRRLGFLELPIQVVIISVGLLWVGLGVLSLR